MSSSIKFVVVSDLHYRKHENSQIRPEVTSRGQAQYDPMESLIRYVQDAQIKADYIICPGDITDKASAEALREGWGRLNELKEAVSARHLITATGNHEVSSRVFDEVHDRAGNVEAAIDPIGVLQDLDGYPSSIWNGVDRDMVYWGKGYEFIDDGDLLLLLINSSHFHPTTRENEFERGRIGDSAIRRLGSEIKQKIADCGAKIFIAVLHHPPISHESPNYDLGRIPMYNGPELINILNKSCRPWLVVHGHKHDGRVVMAQGAGFQPIVFAAGSLGADLARSVAAVYTRQQAYMIDIEIPQGAMPTLKGTVTSLSWIDHHWVVAEKTSHGVPSGSGFSFPPVDLHQLAHNISTKISTAAEPYLKWAELVDALPELRYIMPGQLEMLRSLVEALGGEFTWLEDHSFPADIAFGRIK
ncbi:metallophosphoesterase [Xanthomonas arboricola pv. juglandis]|uniref:metallophosphoesterase family protein n=1 Tax=Xanthomonas arboricola TaxID=56448 RepID=UPI001AF87A57|nr:metallophosphoesterase [Xanthomonas arboricola]CAG2084438.1 metallophosphoesterase [Xanthomonas arboricola pv. juglandis]